MVTVEVIKALMKEKREDMEKWKEKRREECGDLFSKICGVRRWM